MLYQRLPVRSGMPPNNGIEIFSQNWWNHIALILLIFSSSNDFISIMIMFKMLTNLDSLYNYQFPTVDTRRCLLYIPEKVRPAEWTLSDLYWTLSDIYRTCRILIGLCRTSIELCRTFIGPCRTLIGPYWTSIGPCRTLDIYRTMSETYQTLSDIYWTIFATRLAMRYNIHKPTDDPRHLKHST